MTSGNLHHLVGISTIFQKPLTVPLHSPNGRHLLAIRAVQGDCEIVQVSHKEKPSNHYHVVNLAGPQLHQGHNRLASLSGK